VERARHFVMWDQPHAVMTALYAFLGVEERPRLEGLETRDAEFPSLQGPLI